jgi:hypothetical protein
MVETGPTASSTCPWAHMLQRAFGLSRSSGFAASTSLNQHRTVAVFTRRRPAREREFNDHGWPNQRCERHSQPRIENASGLAILASKVEACMNDHRSPTLTSGRSTFCARTGLARMAKIKASAEVTRRTTQPRSLVYMWFSCQAASRANSALLRSFEGRVDHGFKPNVVVRNSFTAAVVATAAGSL